MMINDFTDDILTHILSYLPFIQAFTTNILSKRWRQLPYSLNTLQIDDKNITGTVISQHLSLNEFRIPCNTSYCLSDCSTFDKWVEAAKKRRVGCLDLELLNVRLAPTVFCCKTLVFLQLSRIRISNMFGCSIDLPFLKTLLLVTVCFDDNKNLITLISGRPALECLTVSLYAQPSAGVTLGGYFKPFSKLNKASIDLFAVPLQAVCNVKTLHISGMGKIIHNQEINLYYKGFTEFRNLIKISLYWKQGIHDWDEVVKILHNSPKLQTLKIEKARNSTTKEDWKYPHHVPECISSHLTKCRIIGYETLEADFRFAKYILQNAKLLRNMTIRQLHPETMEIHKCLQDLESCPRISPACELLFQVQHSASRLKALLENVDDED